MNNPSLLNETESLDTNLSWINDFPDYDRERLEDFDLDERHEYQKETEAKNDTN